jgi:hypothetical protein
MKMKASKPVLHKNSNALYDFQHFAAFPAASVQLKKPLGGPKGLRFFQRLRLKKEPPSAGISNEEQGTPNIEGRRRFAPYISSKYPRLRRTILRHSLFDIRYSIFKIMYNMLVDNFW